MVLTWLDLTWCFMLWSDAVQWRRCNNGGGGEEMMRSSGGRSFQRRGAVIDMARLENMSWEVTGGDRILSLLLNWLYCWSIARNIYSICMYMLIYAYEYAYIKLPANTDSPSLPPQYSALFPRQNVLQSDADSGPCFGGTSEHQHTLPSCLHWQ